MLLYNTCKTLLQNLRAQLTLRELLILIWSIMLILIISYKTIKLTAKLQLIRKLANHFLLVMLLHILIFLRILLLYTNYLCTLVSLFILYYCHERQLQGLERKAKVEGSQLRLYKAKEGSRKHKAIACLNILGSPT